MTVKTKIKHIFEPNRLYKLYNFVRVMCVIVIIADKTFLGVVLLNLTELLSFLFELYFFR